MRIQNVMLLSLPILLCVLAVPGQAASLIGTSVTGSLVFTGDPSNYFDPGYFFVPPADLNSSGTTVTVSNSDVEFGYDDGIANAYSADFTANQLTVTDQVEGSGDNAGLTMMFTDSAFSNQSLVLASASSPFINNYSLTGNVVTLNSAGGSVTAGQTLTETFTFTAVPEPSTVGLLSIVVLLFGSYAAWRRCRVLSEG